MSVTSAFNEAFRAILRKELLLILKDAKFLAITSVMVLLCVVGAYKHARVYAEKLSTFADLRNRAQALADPTWGFIAPREPSPLAFFCETREYELPDYVKVVPMRSRVAGPAGGVRSGMLTGNLDFVLVLSAFGALLAILLGHDVISREREGHSLRIVLSYPVHRRIILTAKVIALWAAVAVSCIVGVLAALLVLVSHQVFTLSGGLAVRIALILFGALLYMSFWSTLAVALSARIHDSAQSLTLSTLLWLVATFVVPPLAVQVAAIAHPSPPAAQLTSQVQEVIDAHAQVAGSNDIERIVRTAPSEESRRQALRDFERALNEGMESKARDADQEIFRLKSAYEQQLLRQAELATTLSLVSPYAILRRSLEALAVSGETRYNKFMAAVAAYDRSINEFVLALRHRTPTSPEREKLSYVSYFGYRVYLTASRPLTREDLNAADFPAFAPSYLSLRKDAAQALLPLGVLIALNAAALAGAMVVFTRAENV